MRCIWIQEDLLTTGRIFLLFLLGSLNEWSDAAGASSVNLTTPSVAQSTAFSNFQLINTPSFSSFIREANSSSHLYELKETVSLIHNESSTKYLIPTTSSVVLGTSPVLSHTRQSGHAHGSSYLSTQSTHPKISSSFVTTQPIHAPSSYLTTQSIQEQLSSFHPSTQLSLHPQTSSSYLSTLSTYPQISSSYPASQSIHPHDSSSYGLAYVEPSSTKTMAQGAEKTFVAEIRITSLNYSLELENETSYKFLNMADDVTTAVDIVMDSQLYYLGSQVISFREGSVISNVEIKMAAGSNSDPNIVLDPLKSAVKSGRFGNLTVDSTYFVGWLKTNPPSREKLLSGQLGGVALIVFIVVVLLLVICLGKFADEPLFQERDIFSMESNLRRTRSSRDNAGIEEEEDWRFDPLFAWSNQKSYDSKL